MLVPVCSDSNLSMSDKLTAIMAG